MDRKIEKNRGIFLDALRSGEYEKGTFVPGQSAPPKGAKGFCAVGLPSHLFGIYKNIVNGMWFTLGLRQKDLDRIQNEWNDSSLTFPQIADLIENQIFGVIGFDQAMRIE